MKRLLRRRDCELAKQEAIQFSECLDCFAVLAMTVALLLTGCVSQNVYIKTSSRVSQLIVDGEDLGSFGPEGREALVPVKFGSAGYKVIEGDKVIANGLLARKQVSPFGFAPSVGGAMVLAPILGLSGAIAANPSWIFAPSVFLSGGGLGSFWAYLAQTASFWTFPAVTLGFAIGLLPLVGLLYSERLPDVVWINIGDPGRR